MGKQEVIQAIREVLQQHPYVVRAELFGSLARGEDRPGSDVDLVLLFDPTRPKGFRFFHLHGELENRLGRRVDIVQDRLLYPVVRQNIRQDREVIYERG